ncbi:hypothetical protein [Empedobacter sp. GD03797]|uniref:hypothetical protein n=1 Tax=Empedobacter sp. GD03797 TaxID=2975382 RepID=UPI00244971BF|nr:hypothetical protein [Empedobacter sp. GD03797]MDH1882910.1 hypothetical protein [Empedobacter sp. GD03797]
MKFLILFLLSTLSFAQKLDTINLNQVEVMNYSNYKQFRPKFKKVERLTDNTSFGLKIFSNLLLPNEKEIEIVAIEILFESKVKKKNYCNEYYYFKPIILKSIDDKQSLIEEKWFEVDKDYQGKCIFPIHLKLKPSEAKNYFIGLETSYENPFCPEGNGYFDLINTSKKSDVFVHYNDNRNSGFRKQELFGNYALNYKIYYK